MNNFNIESLTLFKQPEDSPGFLLWKISTQWRTLLEQCLKEYNLTHPQFVVLATTAWLTRNSIYVSQIDISHATQLDQNTVSQVLRGLEAKEYIVRVRFLNQKNKNPQVTQKGHAILQKALPAVEKCDANFFNTLTQIEQETLLPLFKKLLKTT